MKMSCYRKKAMKISRYHKKALQTVSGTVIDQFPETIGLAVCQLNCGCLFAENSESKNEK